MSGSFFLLGSRIWISRLHRQHASAATVRKVTRQSLLTLRASLPCPETTTASAWDSTDVSELLSDAQHPSPTSASVSLTRAQARFNFQRCRTNFRSHSCGVTFRAAFAPCQKRKAPCRPRARVNNRCFDIPRKYGQFGVHSPLSSSQRRTKCEPLC